MFVATPHKNLSKGLSLDESADILSEEQQQINDIRCSLDDWTTDIRNNVFGVVHMPTDQFFIPTKHALQNLCSIGNMSTTVCDLLEDKTDRKGKTIISRDGRDLELLKHYMDVHIKHQDRADQKKQRLFRTWKDGTLRAVLSDKYAIINNSWVLEQWRKILPPDSQVVKYRGNADTLALDLILPNTPTRRVDGEYGTGFHLGNSEIGEKRVTSMPFLFRSICSNGTVFGFRALDNISQVHRGNIDLLLLGSKIQSQLQNQLSSLQNIQQDIDKIIGFDTGQVPMVNVIVQFCKDNGFSKKEILQVVQYLQVEIEILGDEAKTLFGLQSVITRLSHNISLDRALGFESLAGELFGWDEPRWKSLVNRAGHLTNEDLAKMVGIVTAV